MCRGRKRERNQSVWLGCTTMAGNWVNMVYTHCPSSRYTRTSSSCSLPQMEPHVLAGHTARLVVSCLLNSLIPRLPGSSPAGMYSESWLFLLHFSRLVISPSHSSSQSSDAQNWLVEEEHPRNVSQGNQLKAWSTNGLSLAHWSTSAEMCLYGLAPRLLLTYIMWPKMLHGGIRR